MNDDKTVYWPYLKTSLKTVRLYLRIKSVPSVIVEYKLSLNAN